MAKQSTLHVKNTQLAEAINLSGLRAKLSRKRQVEPAAEPEPTQEIVVEIPPVETPTFSEPVHVTEEVIEVPLPQPVIEAITPPPPVVEELKLGPVEKAPPLPPPPTSPSRSVQPSVSSSRAAPPPSHSAHAETAFPRKKSHPVFQPPPPRKLPPKKEDAPFLSASRSNPHALGPVVREEPPTPVARPERPPRKPIAEKESRFVPLKEEPKKSLDVIAARTAKTEWITGKSARNSGSEADKAEGHHAGWKDQPGKTKSGDNKVGKRSDDHFKSSSDDEDGAFWRRKRPHKQARIQQIQEIVRPTSISVRLPISVKDLAAEMKLKASELIAKLFLQGTTVTLNDMLVDDIMVQLLGDELGCQINIDTREEDRLRVTGSSILEEILASPPSQLVSRPPVVTFMGHVDHGKTSLIDAIRSSNRVKYEAGAITQHIGAFRCETKQGIVTIVDTPGHEAFSAMRERGAGITDLVVLVVAGDEGIQEQTIEALQQAKAASVTILVAINKCDRPAFDQERVFRQLADQNLLPEAWGGQTVTVKCSAVTHEGIDELLELIALQSEVLELRANPSMRARGTVVESEMSKGLGPVATILVRNGTLRLGDCLVCGIQWARVKSLRDESGRELSSAGPSTPVRIHGISGVADAGEEFVVVKNEKEARDIAEKRQIGKRQIGFSAKRAVSVESMMERQGAVAKKVLNIVLRADVQGSMDAVRTALSKIVSDKVEVNVISAGVGEISESDVQLAYASKASILGFHTSVEAHAEPIAKTLGVPIHIHTIIYHAQDAIKELMRALLDKIPEEHVRGSACVRMVFKSSHLGCIAGCQVVDGSIRRNYSIRIKRGDEILYTGSISSLKRFKEDVKEVQKGTECGIVVNDFSAYQENDIIEAFEVTYKEPEL